MSRFGSMTVVAVSGASSSFPFTAGLGGAYCQSVSHVGGGGDRKRPCQTRGLRRLCRVAADALDRPNGLVNGCLQLQQLLAQPYFGTLEAIAFVLKPYALREAGVWLGLDKHMAPHSLRRRRPVARPIGLVGALLGSQSPSKCWSELSPFRLALLGEPRSLQHTGWLRWWRKQRALW
jgi:hypothetical protein